jgi:hypothetical protein
VSSLFSCEEEKREKKKRKKKALVFQKAKPQKNSKKKGEKSACGQRSARTGQNLEKIFWISAPSSLFVLSRYYPLQTARANALSFSLFFLTFLLKK